MLKKKKAITFLILDRLLLNCCSNWPKSVASNGHTMDDLSVVFWIFSLGLLIVGLFSCHLSHHLAINFQKRAAGCYLNRQKCGPSAQGCAGPLGWRLVPSGASRPHGERIKWVSLTGLTFIHLPTPNGAKAYISHHHRVYCLSRDLIRY